VSDPLTLETAPLGIALDQRFRLLVLLEDRSWTFPLPDHGIVTIGRSDDVDVQIADPSISRRHTSLHIGNGLKIEDLGSANGTRWRGEQIPPKEPITIQPGDPIEIGRTLLVVQRALSNSQPPWLYTHEQFEGRLAEEVASSSTGDASFAVLRLHTGTRSAVEVQRVLAQQLRAGEVAALSGPGEYEILLPEVAPGDADQRAAQFRQALEAVQDPVAVGVGCFPRDARNVDSLIERANIGVRATDRPKSQKALAINGMEGLKRIVDRVAQSSINVLITGETGVGKGVLASEIHRRSPRTERPCVVLNCAELQETLLESELFGHERGAFTGANATKQGLIETAQGGTLFLDEIGEMSLATQAKLLRVLEERSVRRVGGLQQRPVDIRLIAASNRDLEAESERGAFRRDLFFRLNGILLYVPPLRERVDEIELLARGFIAQAAADAKCEVPVLSREALFALQQYPWPGNIRELRNMLERAVVLCTDGLITTEQLSLVRGRRSVELPPNPVTTAPLPPDPSPPLPTMREQYPGERQRIIDALEQCAGNQSRAAKVLGMSRATLVARLDIYGLPRPRKRLE
jgi:DNA-binding NtrC family response regulator/pSer/pThr/pTyr-binding forkhead associated (FHA) protein